MRRRILHVLPHARSLAGTERSVLDLLGSRELAAYEQRVAFVRGGQVQGFEPGLVLASRAGLVPAALRFRPDLVHGWLLQGNLAAAVVKRLRPSARFIASERNVGHTLTPAKRLLERLVAATEDAATANSEAVRDAAVSRIPARAQTMRVLMPGVAPLPRPRECPPYDAVMVGRLHRVKDHGTALRAWAAVRRDRPDARLAIVGDGPEREALEREAAMLGLGSAVTFAGETDPAPYLYGAKLYLLSSRAEGFSRALLEGLAAGLPVVSTDVGGAAELPPDAVRRVAVGDARAMADAALALLDDERSRSAAGHAARRAAARYAPGPCHAAYAALYEELLG